MKNYIRKKKNKILIYYKDILHRRQQNRVKIYIERSSIPSIRQIFYFKLYVSFDTPTDFTTALYFPPLSIGDKNVLSADIQCIYIYIGK